MLGGGGWTNRTTASFLGASSCDSFCRRTNDLLSFAVQNPGSLLQAPRLLTN